MLGIDLAEEYYRSCWVPQVHGRIGALEERIAVGLVGPGSECFRFDDAISRDHDWGPGFCLWLTDDDHRESGSTLQQAYDALPTPFLGFPQRQSSRGEEWRVGVTRTSAFFVRFTGLNRPPSTPQEWLRIPEHALAVCTNGKVFSDPLGAFTRWREALLEHYPEDVRLRKIAALCITLAQTGQYNFRRMMKRGDLFAAEYTAMKFCVDAIALVFLLNRRYAPFYKWLHRAVRELPILGASTHDHVARLVTAAGTDERTALMERMAAQLIDALQRQSLSDSSSRFLLDHAPSVRSRIVDPQLREHLPVP